MYTEPWDKHNRTPPAPAPGVQTAPAPGSKLLVTRRHGGRLDAEDEDVGGRRVGAHCRRGRSGGRGAARPSAHGRHRHGGRGARSGRAGQRAPRRRVSGRGARSAGRWGRYEEVQTIAMLLSS